MKAEMPTSSKERHDPAAEATMDLLMGITSGIRNIRGEMHVPPARLVEAFVQSADEEVRKTLEDHRDMIVNLAKLDTLEVTLPGKRPAMSATAVFGESTIFVSLKDIIDLEAEEARLNKEIGRIGKELDGMAKKLSNEGFLNKAPQEVVAGVREKQERLVEKRRKLEGHLDAVRQAAGSA
jgi:valyl-tRNA synthetase